MRVEIAFLFAKVKMVNKMSSIESFHSYSCVSDIVLISSTNDSLNETTFETKCNISSSRFLIQIHLAEMRSIRYFSSIALFLHSNKGCNRIGEGSFKEEKT